MKPLMLKKKTIMAIGAHPDDNDFVAGGTVAKAVREGSKVIYVIATRGDRGSSDRKMTKEKLMKIREAEQTNAARALGVKHIEFLNYEDGKVASGMPLKEDIVRLIRKYRPHMVITMDPAFLYSTERNFVNHSDHRKVGEAAMDAVYPLARDLLSFPEHAKEGLKPHIVKELCFGASFSPGQANAYCDITETFDAKIKALEQHASQIKKQELRRRMKEAAERLGKLAKCGKAEVFKRIELK